MSIARSIEEEMARRIVEEAVRADKVNVLVYQGGFSMHRRGGFLKMHAWWDSTTAPDVVYVRRMLPGLRLHPGGVPCKSAKAIWAMLDEGQGRPVVETGSACLLVVMGDVTVRPFMLLEEQDWSNASYEMFGDRVHKIEVYSNDNTPDDWDTIDYWGAVFEEFAKTTWNLRSS